MKLNINKIITLLVDLQLNEEYANIAFKQLQYILNGDDIIKNIALLKT